MRRNEVAAQWWSEALLIEEKREEFRLALLGILDGLDEWDSLDVDYDPDENLLAALHAVGIECRGNFFSAEGIFVPKTRMQLRRDGQLRAKVGYGGEWVEISYE